MKKNEKNSLHFPGNYCFVITMFAMGKKYHFETSTVINAPAEKVYSNMNSMKAFNQWNPWLDLDPTL